jgi:hypothetical protein
MTGSTLMSMLLLTANTALAKWKETADEASSARSMPSKIWEEFIAALARGGGPDYPIKRAVRRPF